MKMIINISKRLKQTIDNNEGVPGCLLYELYNAIKQGLKVEQCSVCVSKEEVLDLISNYDLSMGEMVRGIHALSPVTPKQRWIPVDYNRYPETYPKAFQEVWITDAYDEVKHKAYDGTRNIKAWMPYIEPEPYKEGENK